MFSFTNCVSQKKSSRVGETRRRGTAMSEPKRSPAKFRGSAVDHCLELIEALARNEALAGSPTGRRLGLAKSTVQAPANPPATATPSRSRLGRYRLGLKFLEVGAVSRAA